MPPNPAEVLVTGGLGFLGAHVCRALIENGDSVVVGDLPGADPRRIADLPRDRVRVVPLNVTDPHSVAAAMAGVDGVVHLVALVKDVAPWRDFRRVTIEGTRNVLDAARRAGVQRFVHVGSLAAHAFADRENATEDTPLDATLRYGRAKALAEQAVWRAHESGGPPCVVVRPGLVPYGPGDTLALPALVEAMKKRQVTLVNCGRGVIGTAFAPDFAKGVAVCLHHPKAGGEAFVLADRTPITWKAYFHTIAEVFGVPPPRVDIPAPLAQALGTAVEEVWTRARPGTLPPLSRYRTQVVAGSHHFSPAKAERLLGFTMTTPFREGLIRTKAAL